MRLLLRLRLSRCVLVVQLHDDGHPTRVLKQAHGPSVVLEGMDLLPGLLLTRWSCYGRLLLLRGGEMRKVGRR